MTSTTRTIIVQCQRQGTTHAKITLSSNYFVFEYGRFLAGQFKSDGQEVLALREYPELRTLHDGYGWNTEALFATVACVTGNFYFEADGVTPAHLADLLLSARPNKKA